ncbi:MAG: protein-disulfide reductase DsbD domain-containing protein [Pseudomonadota bacterium]
MPGLRQAFACFFAVCSLGFLSLTPALAASGSWAQDMTGQNLASARIGTAQNAVLGEILDGAIEVKLKKGWKTYWHSPGDAGLPPVFDWSESSNIRDIVVHFTTPERFSLFGFETFGYSDSAFFPIQIHHLDRNNPLTLKLRLDLLVCEEICVPVTVHPTLHLPASPDGIDTHVDRVIDHQMAAQIAQANQRIPRDAANSGFTLLDSTANPDSSRLDIAIGSSIALEAPDLVPATKAGWNFASPELRYDQITGRLFASFAVTGKPDPAASLDEMPIAWTLLDNRQGWSFAAHPVRVATDGIPASYGAETSSYQRAASTPARPALSISLWVALLFALLGGLILNAMPCVLPVLSLKLASIIHHADQDRLQIRRSFLASAAGILVSFWMLALAAILVKLAGGTPGWGTQFQQPLFLFVMAAVIMVFAGTLMDWYQFNLPGWLRSRITTRHSGRQTGAFFEGMFATLLATPCSAPFLGTAISFALVAEGQALPFLIFTALALGMSLPWLMVAAIPSSLRLLPAPGRWMIWLRRGLALGLFLTGCWLLSVLSAQIPPSAVMMASAAILALMLALVLVHHRRAGTGWFAASLILAVGLLGGSLYQSFAGNQASAEDQTHKVEPEGPTWQRFDRTVLDAYLDSGKTILVDVTADWCISCIVNKKLVLEARELQTAFVQHDVILMQADWTNPDPAIEQYLRDFDRYAIPFNAIYGPASPHGLVMPVLLTKSHILNGLAQAGIKLEP